MAKHMVGFDIGTTNILVTDTRGTVAYRQMPGNLVDEDGDGIASPESLVTYFKGLKKDVGFKKDDIAIVLPERVSYYRTINCPVMSADQIKLNLPYEFRNFVGPDAAKYNYDYIVDSVVNDEEGKPVSLNLTAAAGLRDFTEGYAAIFKKAGFNMKLALPKEICLMNLMKKVAKEDQEYCLVGLNENYTNIYIFKGANIEATKAIEIGNKSINHIIAQVKNVDEMSADVMRDTNKDDCLGDENLKGLYEKIALEVMKTINFYKYEHNDSTLETAYFFDLGANNEYLINAICETIEYKQGDIKDLIPDGYKNTKDAYKCLVTMGLVL